MFNFKACLLALSLVASLVMADPEGLGLGLAEVDLVFPRNDTFEPMPLMPLVFAIQNYAAFKKLYASIEYRLELLHRPQNATFIPFRSFSFEDLPTNESTVFLRHGFPNLVNTENTWKLQWKARWTNCSTSDDGTAFDDDHGIEDWHGFHTRTYEPYQNLIFTTREGGRQPNLTTLTTGDDCDKTQAFTFNVTKTLRLPLALEGWGPSSCALLASPPPTPRPCKASVPPKAASSISSTLTHIECFASTPAVSCPTKTGGATVHGPGAKDACWTAGFFAWLFYHLVGIL